MLINHLPAGSNVGSSPIRQDHRRRNIAPHGSTASHPDRSVLTPTARCCSGTGRVTYSPDLPAITGSTRSRVGHGVRGLTTPMRAGSSPPTSLKTGSCRPVPFHFSSVFAGVTR
jgi:hypothetical protein